MTGVFFVKIGQTVQKVCWRYFRVEIPRYMLPTIARLKTNCTGYFFQMKLDPLHIVYDGKISNSMLLLQPNWSTFHLWRSVDRLKSYHKGHFLCGNSPIRSPWVNFNHCQTRPLLYSSSWIDLHASCYNLVIGCKVVSLKSWLGWKSPFGVFLEISASYIQFSRFFC